MLTRILRTAAATVLATAALVGVSAAPASAQSLTSCPGGQRVCVYLPAGSYTLGNPVTTSTGAGPVTRVLLNRCDSSGTQCETTYLLLPGLTVTSTSTSILTLNVPGQGVGLSGTTPTLYLGLPSASLGTLSAGLSLHVQGTTFVVYDTVLNGIACAAGYVPPNPWVSGTYSPCGVDLTVTV